MNEITLNSFFDEIVRLREEHEKTGGLREGLKTFFTGRIPLYHGSSASRVSSILEEGLKPQASRGISSVVGVDALNDGLAFTTRNKGVAKSYAAQQTALERADKLHAKFPKIMDRLRKSRLVPQRVTDFLGNHPPPDSTGLMQIAQSAGPARGALLGVVGAAPGKRNIARFDIPRSMVAQKAVANPEVTGFAVRQNPEIAAAFATDVVMKGGVPAEFARGSSKYRRVTAREVKDHVVAAAKNPKAFAKDVAKSTLGISTDPRKLINSAREAQMNNLEADALQGFMNL